MVKGNQDHGREKDKNNGSTKDIVYPNPRVR